MGKRIIERRKEGEKSKRGSDGSREDGRLRIKPGSWGGEAICGLNLPVSWRKEQMNRKKGSKRQERSKLKQ